MSENDLGTAHGRIRITYEGKGADKANAALLKMQAKFEALQKRVSVLEKELSRANSELDRTSSQMTKTARSSDFFSKNILKTSRNIRSFRSDVRLLRDDIRDADKFIRSTSRNIGRFATVIKVFNAAGQYGGNQQLAIFRQMSIAMADIAAKSPGTARALAQTQNKLFSVVNQSNKLLGTRSGVTLLGSAYLGLRNKILGVDSAINKSPGWIRQMNRLATTVKLVGSSMGLLAIAIGPLRLLDRLANTGAFNVLVRGTGGLAKAFQRLGGVTQSVFGRDYFAGFANRLLRTESSMTKFLSNSGENFKKLSERIAGNAGSMLRWAQSSRSLVAGIALVTNGFSNLWQRLQWFFKLPKALMAGMAVFFARILPTALYATSKALTGLSNFIAGLWDGIKQLSGGLTVIPGLLAGLGASITALLPVFKGLKDSFKDVFSDDPEKAMAAYMALPQHLRPIADAIKKFIPQWKDLQKAVQSFAFKGVDQQIESLGSKYLPILEQGSFRVVGALKSAKNAVVDFLESQKTQADVKNIYGDTAQGYYQIADAIKPALRGFMDMAAVGTDFLKTTAVWVPILSEKFAEWARVNRENGNMSRWMQESKQGIFDLVKGTSDLAKGLYRIVTIFQTDSGDGFLDRYADAMERFNRAIQNSAVDGFLHDISQAVKDMGEKKIDDIVELFHVFQRALQAIIPFVSQLSQAFSGIFIPALTNAVKWISLFLETLNATGITKFIGWILGAVAGVKLLPKVFQTAITAGKILFGVFLLFRNQAKVVSGITLAFTALGSKLMGMKGPLGTLGNGMNNVSSAFDKTAGAAAKLISGLTLVGTAALAFFALYSSGTDRSEAFNKQIDDNKKSVVEFGDALRKSFLQDRTMVGSSVMDTVSDGLNTMMGNLDSTAQNAPGIMDHIYDYFFRTSDRAKGSGPFEDFLPQLPALFGDSDQLNQQQELSRAAEGAKKKFDELKESGVDLNKVVVGTSAGYEDFTNNLRKSGQDGIDAANKLDEYRKKFEQIEQNMRTLGPAGADVANGIKMIGEAAADSSQKLDGLRLILQGLGYLKTNTLQATAEYTDAIQTMADKVSEALDGIADSTDAWDAQAQSLNLNSKAGRALLDVLVPISTKFQAMAANGGDATQMWADMQTEIDNTVTALNNAGVKINKDQFVKFLQQSLGTAPVPIQIALQTGDNSDTAKAMKQMMLSLQSMADMGVWVNVNFDTENDAKKWDQELEKILGHDITDVNGTNVVLKAGVQLQPDDLAQLQAKLQTLGFNFGPQGANVSPTPIAPKGVPPVAPSSPPAPSGPVAPAAPVPTPSVFPGQQTAAPNQVPPTPTPQVIVGDPATVVAALDTIKAKMDEIDKFNPTIDFNLDLTQTAIDRLSDVQSKIQDIKSKIQDDKIVIDIQVLHVNESNFDLDRLKSKLDEVSVVVNAISSAFGAAFAAAQAAVAGFVTETGSKLDELVAGARSSGSKFTDALAEGMEQNPAALRAAERMAQEIKDRFHQSPPKKGPLSAHGDAARYAGGAFVKSYATGIARDGSAISAAEKMGQGVTTGAMAGDKNYEAGKFLGQFSQLVNFATMAKNAFDKVAQTFMSAVKFAADPLGKGTFFGKRQGFVRDPNLSAQERREKTEDAAQQRAISFYDSGQRNTDWYDEKTGMPTIPKGLLQRNASKKDIQGQIAAVGQSKGATAEDIAAAFAIVDQETGKSYDAAIRGKGMGGGGADAYGLFQQTEGMWGTKEELTDPNIAIQKYWDAWAKTQGSSAADRAVRTQNPGGYNAATIQGRIAGGTNKEAAELFAGTIPSIAKPDVPGVGIPAPANQGTYGLKPGTDTGGYGTGTGSTFPQWMMDLGKQYGVTPSTYAGHQESDRNEPGYAPNPQHLNRGVDWTGSVAQMQAFAEALQRAAPGNPALEQIIWQNPNTKQRIGLGGAGNPTTGYYPSTGDGSYAEHENHVHTRFNAPFMMRYNPTADTGLNYAVPRDPDEKPPAPKELVVKNADGTFSPVHGTGDKPGDIAINPATNAPWTPEETAAFYNDPRNAKQYDKTQIRDGDLDIPGIYQGTQDQMLDALKNNNPDLAKAIASAEDYKSSEDDTISALNLLQEESQRQKDLNTPESRAKSSQIDSIISKTASDRGLVEDKNPVDKATDVIGSVSSIAGDLFQVFNSVIEAVGATKDIGDTLVRGVENTEDVFRIIDDIQKYIQLGADIAGAVASVTGAIGSVIPDEGTFGAGAAVSAIGQIAGIIQSALETVNAVIDLGQEAYRIIGTYVGEFLGILTGGAGGSLQGNVKFLLDEQTNQLLTYSADNPLDKRAHDLMWKQGTPESRNQMIGTVNVFGGPGQDPRDNTRQMMFQVKASTMGQATGQ